MSRALKGLRAIVTGAGSGLGRSIAERFAQEGAILQLCDRNAEGLEETAVLARSAGATVFTSVFDLGDMDAIAQFVDEAASNMGGIDIVCNNAALTTRSKIDDQEESGWDAMLAINLKSPYFLIKYALPHLRRSEHKAIVNISSMAGTFGMNELSAYCASKGGVNALTKALATELAPEGIRVNCVSPGSMMTPALQASLARSVSLGRESEQDAVNRLTSRQLFKRVGETREVAAIALFLASSEASYLTGEVIMASAGWAAH